MLHGHYVVCINYCIISEPGDEFVKKLTGLITMNKITDKDDYSGALQFLCSPASAYTNGQNIVIDGGRSVL